MNTTTMKKTIAGVAIALASVLTITQLAQAATFAPLTSQMGVGSRGSSVTNLQTFLASDHNIYPEAMVTGYYGGFTRAAVVQFQNQYEIPMVGVVGPMTLARMNSVIAAGYGIDVYAPSIYNVSTSTTVNSATFNWATNESTRGKVYYSTSPFTMQEAVGSFQEPSIMGGSNVLTANMQTNQSVTIPNLQSHTTYYYIIQAQDASGNVSVTLRSTLTTN